MTILHLISSEGYYGVESMLVALARELSRRKCRNIVAVFEDARRPHTEIADEAAQAGLEVEILPCAGRIDHKPVKGIRSLIRKHRVDVLHSHGYKADFYSYAAAFRESVALCATSHNWPDKQIHMRAYAALDRFMLRKFDRVVTVSPVVAKALRRAGVASNKLTRIWNGVDVDRFHSVTPISKGQLGLEGKRIIGFVARLVPGKGGAVLLRAAQKLILERPDVALVFVGDGPARSELEDLAAVLGMKSSVIFTGCRRDMPGIYASFDILVLPSFDEAMPMCVLEAMAAGKPVIATRVGAIPEAIADEVTGLLVEPGDVDGLTAAMDRLLENPNLASNLGMQAHARAVERFSVERMTETYLSLYRDVLDTRNHRTGQVQAVKEAWN